MNSELIERIDSLFSAYTEGGKRSSSMSVIKILTDCRAALSQADPVSVQQDVEAWIEDHTHEGDGYEVVRDHVYVEDLRAWMAGHARVPVEPLAMNETKSIREILFRGWPGCSNHGCIVRGEQQGMATNGQCKCLVDASRTQLHMLQGRLSAVIRAQEPHNE